MKKVILTAGMLLWAVHPALAQSADPSLLIHEQFAKIDTNGDGEISEEEFLDYKMEETKKVTAKFFPNWIRIKAAEFRRKNIPKPSATLSTS